MKRLIPILLLLLITLTATAQNDRRFWSDGPLTWSDFTVVPTSSHPGSSLQYVLAYMPVCETIYDCGKEGVGIPSHFYRAQAWMVSSSLYVTEGQQTDFLLRYNQLVFNMLEVERRKLQQSLATYTTTVPNNILWRTQEADEYLSKRIKLLNEMVVEASDTALLPFYEDQVAKELSQWPAVYVPQYSPLPFGYGVYVGLGATGSTGSLGKAFGPGIGINLGFDFSYKRHYFILDATLGYCRVRQTLALNDGKNASFTSGTNASFSLINFGYGFHLVDNCQLQLTPFVALGIQDYSFGSSKEGGLSYARPEPVVGIQFRRHFRQSRTFPSYNDSRSRHESELNRISLQCRLLAAYSSFPELESSPAGITFGVQFAVSLNSRRFEVK